MFFPSGADLVQRYEERQAGSENADRDPEVNVCEDGFRRL
jgi:hypothetical protein